MFDKEFSTFLFAMIAGGLVYSILSFSYMHSTFSTKENVQEQISQIYRVEDKLDQRLTNIESKLDRIIEKQSQWGK